MSPRSLFDISRIMKRICTSDRSNVMSAPSMWRKVAFGMARSSLGSGTAPLMTSRSPLVLMAFHVATEASPNGMAFSVIPSCAPTHAGSSRDGARDSREASTPLRVRWSTMLWNRSGDRVTATTS